ncbi:MAG: hypothetical protein HQ500_03160 [Flavobacteriales bacterium]|nr:hypothetical protein [Flavobacteriales bacterium]
MTYKSTYQKYHAPFRIVVIAFVILLLQTEMLAQNMSINETGANPDSSLMLDVTSTSNGILVSSVADAQRDVIVNPSDELMIFQTDLPGGLYAFDRTDIGWGRGTFGSITPESLTKSTRSTDA